MLKQDKFSCISSRKKIFMHWKIL